MKATKKYRVGSGFDVYGTIEFLPDGRCHEEPQPGNEHDLAGYLKWLRDGQKGSEDGVRGWLDHHAGVRTRFDGLWVEKARPDGTFEADDPPEDDDDEPQRMGRAWSEAVRYAGEQPTLNPGAGGDHTGGMDSDPPKLPQPDAVAQPPRVKKNYPDIEAHADVWMRRKRGLIDAIFDVGHHTGPDGVSRAVPFTANMQRVASDVYDFDPAEPEHAFVMSIQDAFGGDPLTDSPREFNFENIRTAHGDDKNPFGVTGTGHAKEVIRRASGLLVGFLHRFKPKLVYYTAAEKSRADLYDFLTRRVGHYLDYAGFRASVPGDNRSYFATVRDDVVDNFLGVASKLGVKTNKLS
jgi:hypothetical protein